MITGRGKTRQLEQSETYTIELYILIGYANK